MTNKTPAPKTPSRRAVLAGAAGAACAVALGLGALAGVQVSARAATALRPPGALPGTGTDESDFLAACSRCGLCVRACPYDTLKLAGMGGPAQVGTPYFDARAIPCEMCEDIPCVVACPTGALDPALTDINDADMGVAVLVGRETCLNLLGLRCDVCYRVCPLIDEAIVLVSTSNPRTGVHAIFEPFVISDRCTGCGKCEHACVLPDESAIKVMPRSQGTASSAEHYRLGWEERLRHGGSLVPDTIEPVRRDPTTGGLKGFKP